MLNLVGNMGSYLTLKLVQICTPISWKNGKYERGKRTNIQLFEYV